MAIRRQMICIHTIVDTLRIPFDGDLRSDREVVNFIKRHYEKAWRVRNQIRELGDLIDNYIIQIGIEDDVTKGDKFDLNKKKLR